MAPVFINNPNVSSNETFNWQVVKAINRTLKGNSNNSFDVLLESHFPSSSDDCCDSSVADDSSDETISNRSDNKVKNILDEIEGFDSLSMKAKESKVPFYNDQKKMKRTRLKKTASSNLKKSSGSTSSDSLICESGNAINLNAITKMSPCNSKMDDEVSSISSVSPVKSLDDFDNFDSMDEVERKVN